jgi:hypothetical protein
MSMENQRKGPARIIEIDSVRTAPLLPVPPPQPTVGKRKFYGNQSIERSVLAMFWQWRGKVARFHRIPHDQVEQHVFDGIQERRAA